MSILLCVVVQWFCKMRSWCSSVPQGNLLLNMSCNSCSQFINFVSEPMLCGHPSARPGWVALKQDSCAPSGEAWSRQYLLLWRLLPARWGGALLRRKSKVQHIQVCPSFRAMAIRLISKKAQPWIIVKSTEMNLSLLWVYCSRGRCRTLVVAQEQTSFGLSRTAATGRGMLANSLPLSLFFS